MKKLTNYPLIIMLRSAIAFVRVATKSAVAGFLGYMTRERADRYIREWASNMLRYVGISLVVEGQKPSLLPSQKIIIMSNHASLYDIPIIFTALPGSIRMIAKKELYRAPVLGWMLKHHEFIRIDRQNRDQALKDLQHAKEKMEDGIVLWAAPEGTRTRTGQLLPFKKGIFRLAIETQASILPVGISGAFDVLPPDTWHFQPGKTVRVRVGEPISTAGYTRDHCAELSERVREAIAGLCD